MSSLAARLTATLLAVTLAACNSGRDVTRPEPSSADPPSGDASPPAFPAFLAWQPPGWQDATRQTVTYRRDGDTQLDMDLYSPPSRREPTPVVVILHGVTPDPDPKRFEGLVAWGQSLAASGVTGAVINYRPSDGGLSEAAMDDVAEAIRYLRQHATELRIDGSRIGMLGFSAAGPYLTASAFRPANQPVRAVAALYAAVEPTTGEGDEEVSLSGHLASHPDVAAFVAFGAQDTTTTINDSVRRFTRTPVADSQRVTVCRHPQGVHGFDFRNDDASSIRIIQAALAFFARELNTPGRATTRPVSC